MSARQPSISIHITSIGRQSLIHTLESIAAAVKNSGYKVKIYLSLQGEILLPNSLRDSLDLVILQTSVLGASHGKNQTLSRSNDEFLLFTDDDCIVDPEWIINCIVGLKQSDIVFGKTQAFGNKHKTHYCPCTFDLGEQPILTTQVQPHWLTVGFSNNMAVNRSVFEKIGGFHTWLGPGSRLGAGLDAEFIIRAISAGFHPLYLPKALVFHNKWIKKGDAYEQQSRIYNRGGLGAYTYHLCNHIPQVKPIVTQHIKWGFENIIKYMRESRQGKRTLLKCLKSCLQEIDFIIRGLWQGWTHRHISPPKV